MPSTRQADQGLEFNITGTILVRMANAIWTGIDSVNIEQVKRCADSLISAQKYRSTPDEVRGMEFQCQSAIQLYRES